MSLPVGLQTVTVLGEYLHPDGTPFQGRVVFTPEPATITSAEHGVIILGEAVATPGADGQLRPIAADGTGAPGIALLATDAAGCTPTGWTYRVREQWYDAARRDYPVSLPAAAPVVKLADVAPTDPAAGEYVVVTGPAGPAGPAGPKGDPGSGGGAVASVNDQTGVVRLVAADVGADPAGAAAAAQTAATTAATADATSKVTAHANAVDPHGDRASAASLYVPLTDGRLTDARTPTGAAGGALKGTYPSPQLADATVASFDAAGAASAAQAAAIAAIPSAATTVTAETAYGQASATGTAAAYARQDHTHGSPALTSTAPATTEGIATAAAVGTATEPARADHVHPMAAAGAPAASAVTSTQATGVASTFAASDHVHAREGFGAVTSQTSFGAASSAGTAAMVAHSDHAHGTPTLPTASVSTPGIVQLDGTATDITALGTRAAGVTGKAADAGHTHPTTGVVLTAGDQAVDGIKTFSAIPLLPAVDPTSDNQAARRAYVDEESGWGLSDYQAAGAGIKAWTGNPGYAAGASVLTTGRIQMNKVWLRTAATISNITVIISNTPTLLTSGQNFAGLYDATGNLLAVTADQTTAWGAPGGKTMALTSPYAAAVGGYYVALLCNSTGALPTVVSHGNSGASAYNFGLTAANARGILGTGTNTAMPPTIALASQGTTAFNFMAFLT